MAKRDDRKKPKIDQHEEPFAPEVDNKDNAALQNDKDMPSDPTKPLGDVPAESNRMPGTEEAAMAQDLKKQHPAGEKPISELTTNNAPVTPPKAVVVDKPTLGVGAIDAPSDGPGERQEKAKKRLLDAEEAGQANIDKIGGQRGNKNKKRFTDRINEIPPPGRKTDMNTGGLNRHEGAALAGIQTKFHSLLPVKNIAYEMNAGVNMWEQAKQYVNSHYYYRFRSLAANMVEGNFGFLRGEINMRRTPRSPGDGKNTAEGYHGNKLVALNAVTASIDATELDVEASSMAPEGTANPRLRHKFHMLMCLATPHIAAHGFFDAYKPWVELVGLQRTPCPVLRNESLFPPHVRVFDTQESILQGEQQVMTQDVDSWNKIVASKLLAGEHVDKSTKARYLDGVISKGAWTECTSYGGVLFSALADMERIHRLATAAAFDSGAQTVDVMNQPNFCSYRLKNEGEIDDIGHAGGIVAKVSHAAHIHQASPRHVTLVADDATQAKCFMKAWNFISASRKTFCYHDCNLDVRRGQVGADKCGGPKDPLDLFRGPEFSPGLGGDGKVYTDIHGGEVRPQASPMLHILVPNNCSLDDFCCTAEDIDESVDLPPGVALAHWISMVKHQHTGEIPSRVVTMCLRDPTKPDNDPTAKEPVLIFPGEFHGLPAGSSEKDFRASNAVRPYRDETWRVWYVDNEYTKGNMEAVRNDIEVFVAAYAKQHMITDGMAKCFQETVSIDALRILHGAPSIGSDGEAKWGQPNVDSPTYLMAHPLPCYKTYTTQSHCDKFATARLLRLVEHNIEGWAGLTSLLRGPFDTIYSRSLDNFTKIQITLCIALASAREFSVYLPLDVEELETVVANKDELDVTVERFRTMFLKGMKSALLSGKKSPVSIRSLSIAATVLGEKLLSANMVQQLNRPEKREFTVYASDNVDDWNNEGSKRRRTAHSKILSCNIRFGNYYDGDYKKAFERQMPWVVPSAGLQSWTGWRLWSNTNLQAGDILRMADFETYDVQSVPTFIGPEVSYGAWEDDIRQGRLNMFAFDAANTNDLYAFKKMARMLRIPQFMFQIWEKETILRSMTPTFPHLPVPLDETGRFRKYAITDRTQSPCAVGVEPHMVFAELPTVAKDGSRIIPFISLFTDVCNMINRRHYMMMLDDDTPAEKLPLVSAIEDPLMTMKDAQLPTAPRDAPLKVAMEF